MAERDQEPVQQEEDALSEASIAVAGQEHRVRRPRAQDNVQPAAPDQAEGQQPAAARAGEGAVGGLRGLGGILAAGVLGLQRRTTDVNAMTSAERREEVIRLRAAHHALQQRHGMAMQALTAEQARSQQLQAEVDRLTAAVALADFRNNTVDFGAAGNRHQNDEEGQGGG